MVAYDLEGVLVDDISIWVKLSRAFGTDGIDPGLREEYLAGRISYREWSDLVVSRWKGCDLGIIEEIVRSTRLMEGAIETVSSLREKGVRQVIITNSISHLADAVGEMLGIGKEWIRSNVLGVEDGKLTGTVEYYHSWEDKLSSLNYFASLIGCGMEEVAVVGDGINDIEILQAAGLGIAFDPKDPGVCDAADVVVRRKDLREILGWVERPEVKDL